MIKPSIQIRGVHAHIIALQKMVQGDAVKIRDGMDACAQIIYDESQYLVPVDKGPLKASGKKVVEGTGLNTTISVQYGGETAPYAWIVHYDPTKYHEHPTQDHYLSDAILITKDQCQKAIGRYMKDFLGQGLTPNIEGV